MMYVCMCYFYLLMLYIYIACRFFAKKGLQLKCELPHVIGFLWLAHSHQQRSTSLGAMAAGYKDAADTSAKYSETMQLGEIHPAMGTHNLRF